MAHYHDILHQNEAASSDTSSETSSAIITDMMENFAFIFDYNENGMIGHGFSLWQCIWCFCKMEAMDESIDGSTLVFLGIFTMTLMKSCHFYVIESVWFGWFINASNEHHLNRQHWQSWWMITWKAEFNTRQLFPDF